MSGEKGLEASPEAAIKVLESKVYKLIEESAFEAAEGNYQHALEKAKEAGKKERQLSKQREQTLSNAPINFDLTYCVLFNLANQYQSCKMHQEALNTYSVIVKNKLFNQSGRLRVNSNTWSYHYSNFIVGNIYFEQKKYSQAIKMYRMALDQIPSTNKDIRLKIQKNIGNAFIKMGQYQDAITSFDSVADGSSDYSAGFNLILCYYALGDKEKMKRSFQKLLNIKPVQIEQHEEISPSTSEPIEGTSQLLFICE